MVAQNVASTTRSNLLKGPQISSTAYIHSFSVIEGAVQVGAETSVAPGAFIRSEGPIFIGESCRVQDGAAIQGLGESRVLGDNDRPYSVWLGQQTVLGCKALVYGPAYIGEGCFIGFRSTVFNARIGQGAIVMMHALVQDVEIPPGKYVASGSVITQQQQADQLPDVKDADRSFAHEVFGSRLNQTKAKAQNIYTVPIQVHHQPRPVQPSTPYPENRTMQSQRLTSEIIQQLRQFLSQGYRIGMEHADQRRYRSGVWETCPPIRSNREPEAIAALESCLAEHQGEYVRMFGIDPKVKQRVGTVTIQRPDGPIHIETHSVQSARSGGSGRAGGGYSNGSSRSGANGLNSEVVQQVRDLLQQGYQIGTEHADPRRYKSGVWKICSPIESRREPEVLASLKHCLDEHQGEYVRMFGIEPRAKRRVATTTIQRADGKSVHVPVSSGAAATRGQGFGNASHQPTSGSRAQGGGSANLGSDTAQQVGQILRQGHKIGVEYADQRRYRSGIWQTGETISSGSESAAMRQLGSFLSQHPDRYVRIFGIDPKAKRRSAATTIQKPGQTIDLKGDRAAREPLYNEPPQYDFPPNRGIDRVGNSNGNGGGHSLDPDLMNQVTQLINQGYRINIEYADQRRYRSGAWQTGQPITAARPAEAIAALGTQLAQHQGHYVRLIGIDPQAKRRILETTIQRP